MNKEDIVKALAELRKEEKRKFSQSVDLIINLKNFDMKKESINLFVPLPHKFKEIKTAGFLNAKSKLIDSVTKEEFGGYKGKEAKKLIKSYDFFVASGSLMPAVATTFGRYLGPAGKMPSPQLGILMKEDDASVQEVIKKAEKMVRIKAKEPSIKLSVGKENMRDEEIAENVVAVYNAVVNALAKQKESLKDVLIKFTMGKPVKVKM